MAPKPLLTIHCFMKAIENKTSLAIQTLFLT